MDRNNVRQQTTVIADNIFLSDQTKGIGWGGEE
jgi:hypothetical protein